LLALEKLEKDRQENRTPLENIELTGQDVSAILAFLSSLTDPCVEDRDCLDAWIPGDDDADPDGLRVNAFDKDGNLL